MATTNNTTASTTELSDDINAKLDALHAMLDAARAASGSDFQLYDDTVPDLLYYAMTLTREVKEKVEALHQVAKASFN